MLREVARRLSARLGRPTQLIALEDAEKAPLLLAEVLRDGRVLVDRDETWDRLCSAKATIDRRAVRERRRIDSESPPRSAPLRERPPSNPDYGAEEAPAR